jgi:RNA polymerase sigma-70 factor (ECF subfamily)
VTCAFARIRWTSSIQCFCCAKKRVAQCAIRADPHHCGALVEVQLDAHCGYLLRVARLQLRDESLAEDVVQETLLAALSGSGFSGKSSLKTWLTGILKHKIVDAIRRKQREPLLASTFDEECDIEDLDGLFKANGAWDSPPAEWGDPEQALNRSQFFDMMDFCLEKLPPNTARAFMMREVMELDSDEICRELRIKANNLWVILYRARMALRECLEQNWFKDGGARA